MTPRSSSGWWIPNILARRSAMGKFPLLVEGGAAVFEATAITEYLEADHPGRVRMIPASPEIAVKVRMMDRVFDNYVMNVMTVIVGAALRPEEHRDPYGVESAHANLDWIYAWLDGELGGCDWACGAEFTLADCAAAPSLFCNVGKGALSIVCLPPQESTAFQERPCGAR